jgi:hypothetical protein
MRGISARMSTEMRTRMDIHKTCGGMLTKRAGGGGFVVRRGCEQRDFHAHDKRVFERDRGARTRSVRGLVLHQTCWLRQHAPVHASWDGVARRDLSWAWVDAKRLQWNVRCRLVHDPRKSSRDWGCFPGVRRASPLATLVCCKAAQDKCVSYEDDAARHTPAKGESASASPNVLASPTCTCS